MKKWSPERGSEQSQAVFCSSFWTWGTKFTQPLTFQKYHIALGMWLMPGREGLNSSHGSNNCNSKWLQNSITWCLKVYFSPTLSQGNEVGFLPRTPELRKKTAGASSRALHYLSPEYLTSHMTHQQVAWGSWEVQPPGRKGEHGLGSTDDDLHQGLTEKTSDWKKVLLGSKKKWYWVKYGLEDHSLIHLTGTSGHSGWSSEIQG